MLLCYLIISQYCCFVVFSCILNTKNSWQGVIVIVRPFLFASMVFCHSSYFTCFEVINLTYIYCLFIVSCFHKLMFSHASSYFHIASIHERFIQHAVVLNLVVKPIK